MPGEGPVGGLVVAASGCRRTVARRQNLGVRRWLLERGIPPDRRSIATRIPAVPWVSRRLSRTVQARTQHGFGALECMLQLRDSENLSQNRSTAGPARSVSSYRCFALPTVPTTARACRAFLPPTKTHVVFLAAAPDPDFEILGQRVHHRHTRRRAGRPSTGNSCWRICRRHAASSQDELRHQAASLSDACRPACRDRRRAPRASRP